MCRQKVEHRVICLNSSVILLLITFYGLLDKNFWDCPVLSVCGMSFSNITFLLKDHALWYIMSIFMSTECYKRQASSNNPPVLFKCANYLNNWADSTCSVLCTQDESNQVIKLYNYTFCSI